MKDETFARLQTAVEAKFHTLPKGLTFEEFQEWMETYAEVAEVVEEEKVRVGGKPDRQLEQCYIMAVCLAGIISIMIWSVL